MADSNIAITAGTGTSVDTRTESTNNHHRQVIVLGDPADNDGVAPVDGTAGVKVNLGADNDVTVTGTVTAELSATDNAVLDDIAAKLATIDADTSALAAGVSTEYQVDVVGALPAGTNAIGKLAANSGVDIGDVDVTSLPATIHSADYDTGGGTDTTLAMGVAVPASGGAAVVGGDVTNGLDVDVTRVSGTVTVDGSGVTQPVSNAGLTELAAAINSSKVDVNIVSSDVATGGTAAADDADFTAGTTSGTPAMGVYESTPTSVTDGDLGTVGITSGRRLKTSATIDAALPAGTNNIGDVDVLSSALPTGASTSAKQDTIIGHLDGVEGLLTTIDSDTSALAGAVSGTEVQVDVLTMPTTTVQATNLDVRDLTAASDSVAIHGDVGVIDQLDLTNSNPAAVAIVDGDGTQITSFGGGTQYTEGDTDATLTGTVAIAEGPSNTATPLQVDASKHLQVDIAASSATVTVDGSGVTQPVSNAGLTELAAAINSNKVDVNIVSSDVATGGTSAADDADFTAGTTAGTPAMGVYESTPTSVTDGDLGTVGITSGRRLKTSATIDAALPAGTNAIGKLAANSGVDIGDVDVTSCALPTGASTLAEQQTQTTHLATIAGDTTDIETAVELIDDTVYVDDTATHSTGSTKVIGIGAVAAPTDASVNANDIGMPAMTTDRKLHVSVQDALPAGTNAIGKLAANSGVDIGDVDVTSIAAGDNNIGNVDIVTVPADPFGANADAAATAGSAGSMQAKFRLMTSQLDSIKTAVETLDNTVGGSELQVDVVTMPTVTVTATNLDVQSGGADLATSTQAGAIQTAAELIDDTVFVDDADWAADTSKHLLVGGVTQVATTANTDGDVTPLTTNAFRELRVAIPESDLATAGTAHVKKYYTNAGAVTDGIIWSPAAGKRWYVTDLVINVSAAATVTLEDDLTAGDSAVMKFELAANSGITHSFNTPLYSGEDAADLLITTSAGNVYVTVTGYEI